MLRYRPAALVCLAVSAGIAVGLYFDFWVPLVVMSLAWSLTMLIRPARRFRIVLIMATLFFGAASLYGTIYQNFLVKSEIDPEKGYFLTGVITEARATENGNRATVDIIESDDGLQGKTLYIYTDVPLKAGDGVYVEATLREANITSKGNGIDYNAFGSVYKSDKIHPKGFKYELLEMRKGVSDTIYRNFSNESSGFYNAIITGDRSGIDDNLNGSFARSGLSHILAISGQHFSILVYSIYSILMLTIQRKKLSSGICIILAVFYTLLVGATPPILRACIMCCAVFAANIAGIYLDSITVLCGALAGIVMVSPYATASVGLQLSFLATLGILTLSEITKRKKKSIIRSKLIALIVTPALITFAANLFCLPVLLCSFDFVSIIAPFSNLAVNIIIGPSLAVAVLSLPIFAFFPSLKELVSVNDFIFKSIKSISDFASSLSFATFSASLPYIKLIILPAITAIVCALSLKRKHILKATSGCLLVIVLIISLCVLGHNSALKSNNLVYVCDNENNSYVFYNNGKHTILIDGYGTEKCSGVILERCVTHLDAYIMTDCTKNSEERFYQTTGYISIDTVYIPERYAGGSFETRIAKTGCNVLYYDKTLTEFEIVLKESNGHYSLQFKNNDICLCVLGGNKTGFFEPCDGLVVTARCIEKELAKQLVPTEYRNLYINKAGDTYFTESLKAKAETVEEHEKSVELRFGEDGLWEVEE